VVLLLLHKKEVVVLLAVPLEDPKLVTTELKVNQTTTSLETLQFHRNKKPNLMHPHPLCLTLKLNS
jgi:hypothetical protein